MPPDPRLRVGGMGRGQKREERERKSSALAGKGIGKSAIYGLVVLVCNLISSVKFSLHLQCTYTDSTIGL